MLNVAKNGMPPFLVKPINVVGFAAMSFWSKAKPR